MHLLLLGVFVDMIAIIENESKNEDLDICSLRHNARYKSDTVKRDEARLFCVY